MLMINGTVHPMDGPIIPQGYVAVQGSKIRAIGPMSSLPPDLEGPIFDAQGGHILPGYVDAHTHLGVFGDGLGFEADDGNESTDPCTPHMRAIDAINPLDHCFLEARQGGVTTVLTGPGSANPISGQFAAIKTNGRWIDEMIIRAPIAMKMALGENPKTVYNERKEAPVTRMGTAAIIRAELSKTLEYLDRQEKADGDEDTDPPDFDPKLEALIPVLKGELPVHIHAHRADDIATAVRICGEFGLKYVIVHGTEGYRVAALLADHGMGVITGPSLCDRSKPELAHMVLENTALLAQAGVRVAICTDHPVIPIQYLPICAALAVRGGMEPEAALAAITLNPAVLAGIDKLVGSLTPGKDADIVVTTGHPLDWNGKIQAVFIGGKQVN